MKENMQITIRDIEELTCLAEAVLPYLRTQKGMPFSVLYLDFENNKRLQRFTFQEAKALSLKEIKGKYLFEILPIAREACRTNPNILCGLTVSDEVDDEYLDDLLAYTWKRDLQQRAQKWDLDRKRKSMTSTLTYDFNEEAVAAAGLTTDELLEDMRSYAEECGIDEIEYGVFSKSGPDAMAMLMGFVVTKADAEPDFIDYLNTWIADIEGSLEDCKESIERRERRKRRK